MARGALGTGDWAKRSAPVAADPSMNACLPVAISRPMTTRAKFGALGQLEKLAILCLQVVEVLRVVTVEAIVVSIIPAMQHFQVVMLPRQNRVILRVEMRLHRFLFVMAAVAVERGGVATGANEFSGGQSDRGRVRELRIDGENGT